MQSMLRVSWCQIRIYHRTKGCGRCCFMVLIEFVRWLGTLQYTRQSKYTFPIINPFYWPAPAGFRGDISVPSARRDKLPWADVIDDTSSPKLHEWDDGCAGLFGNVSQYMVVLRIRRTIDSTKVHLFLTLYKVVSTQYSILSQRARRFLTFCQSAI
jgi:hypothetical protein